MLPSPDRFLSDLVFPLRRHGLLSQPDPGVITDMLDEASRLAAGEESAEPPALFFACARRSRAFGKASTFIVPFLARAQARSVGHVLDVEDVELIIMHARILRREIDFEELRLWFSDRLRPA